VPEKASRRRFGPEYKARILREADQAAAPGQLSALLRREGLYSSHLAAWRKQRDAASLEALALMCRGSKADPHSPLVEETKRLQRENAKLLRKLRRTEVILDVPKKALRDPGDRTTAKRLRERAMTAVADLADSVGTVAACAAVGVSRATVYRKRSPVNPKPRLRAASPSALNAEERQAVLDALLSMPLADKAPAEAYATTLDEGHSTARSA